MSNKSPAVKAHASVSESAAENTLYVDRVIEALTLLCGGKRPERDDVIAREEGASEELQSWAVCNVAAPWATGIGTIEAAQAMANAPEEGRNHQDREVAFPETKVSLPTAAAAELLDKINLAVEEGWTLTISAGGQGSLATSEGIIYFGSAGELEGVLRELNA